MRLREIHIKGFKSIVDQMLALGRVNCFIGANGVGKRNVLEAAGVLGAAASGRVEEARERDAVVGEVAKRDTEPRHRIVAGTVRALSPRSWTDRDP